MLKLQATLDEERAATETERTALLSEIKILLDRSAKTQSERLDAKVNSIRSDMEASHDILKEADTKFGEKMDEWEFQEDKIITGVLSSESTIQRKIDDDWNVRHCTSPTPRVLN